MVDQACYCGGAHPEWAFHHPKGCCNRELDLLHRMHNQRLRVFIDE